MLGSGWRGGAPKKEGGIRLRLDVQGGGVLLHLENSAGEERGGAQYF